jgi:hypothetical protein
MRLEGLRLPAAVGVESGLVFRQRGRRGGEHSRGDDRAQRGNRLNAARLLHERHPFGERAPLQQQHGAQVLLESQSVENLRVGGCALSGGLLMCDALAQCVRGLNTFVPGAGFRVGVHQGLGSRSGGEILSADTY